MKRETITLDGRAQRRLLVITNVLADELTVEEAAVFLGISSRPMRRVLAAYRSEGPGSLIHGNRDRPPSNRLPDEHRRRLAELSRTTYAGSNAEHLADVLADEIKAIDDTAPIAEIAPVAKPEPKEASGRTALKLQVAFDLTSESLTASASWVGRGGHAWNCFGPGSIPGDELSDEQRQTLFRFSTVAHRAG